MNVIATRLEQFSFLNLINSIFQNFKNVSKILIIMTITSIILNEKIFLY